MIGGSLEAGCAGAGCRVSLSGTSIMIIDHIVLGEAMCLYLEGYGVWSTPYRLQVTWQRQQ